MISIVLVKFNPSFSPSVETSSRKKPQTLKLQGEPAYSVLLLAIIYKEMYSPEKGNAIKKIFFFAKKPATNLH